MIKSKRLIIQPFTRSDIDEAFTWFCDPDVMKWIPGGPDLTPDNTKERISKYIDHYKKYGYGKYILRDKLTSEAIGDAGIMHLEGTDFIELGYRIKQKYWRSGYATEAAREILNHSFNILQLKVIHSIVEPENVKSIEILERKLNFVYIQDFVFMGVEMKLYSIEKTPSYFLMD